MHIDAVAHLDHGLTAAHLAWIAERFRERSAFFIETVELPADLPPVACALFGPSVGDAAVGDEEVELVVRGGRGGPSRLVQRSPRETRTLTVIGGPDGDEPCVLYTAFGGPAAPREPWDPSLDDAGRAESIAFWSAHALAR